MGYKQEIKDYKVRALEVFERHLAELEENVLKASTDTKENEAVSKIYLDYQESTLKLIEGKIKIDNEFLKQINIKNLELYQDLEPEKFSEIQDKIIANHKKIIEELKATYEEYATQSRQHLKSELAKVRDDSDLKVTTQEPDDFFPEKMGILSINFAVILVLLIAIIGLIYYYNFM